MGTREFRLLIVYSYSYVNNMLLYYETELEARIASQLLAKGIHVPYKILAEKFEEGFWVELFVLESQARKEW